MRLEGGSILKKKSCEKHSIAYTRLYMWMVVVVSGALESKGLDWLGAVLLLAVFKGKKHLGSIFL